MSLTLREYLNKEIKKKHYRIGLGSNKNTEEFPYHAFILDVLAIELVGAISRAINIEEIDQEGFSKKDFKNAIEKYFPDKYKIIKDDLYKDLRCGLMHFMRPRNFYLNHSEDARSQHLKKIDGEKYFLNFIEFHSDLCLAIDKLLLENKNFYNEIWLGVGSIEKDRFK